MTDNINSNEITIPCDYHDSSGYHQDDGTFLIYGEMGGPLPRVIPCPKCKGANVIKVERSYIEEQIKDLEDDRAQIDAEIARLKDYLNG